jgi:hypothetical protein
MALMKGILAHIGHLLVDSQESFADGSSPVMS